MRLFRWIKSLFQKREEEPVLTEGEIKFKVLLDYELRKARTRFSHNNRADERRGESFIMGGMWREMGSDYLDDNRLHVDFRDYLSPEDDPRFNKD